MSPPVVCISSKVRKPTIHGEVLCLRWELDVFGGSLSLLQARVFPQLCTELGIGAASSSVLMDAYCAVTAEQNSLLGCDWLPQ